MNSPPADHEEKQLKRALTLASYGWHVFPLHMPEGNGCSCGETCGSVGKHPLHDPDDLPNGVSNATIDPELINRWWTRWPGANIAIATGAVSGFFALDIDPRHDGKDELWKLEQEHGRLPHTLEVLTGGGGQHYYFAHPGWPVKNRMGKAAVRSGVEIKGEGGYVVAAGSLHQLGKYQWEISSVPGEAPLAAAPEWLLRETQESATPSPSPIPDRILDGSRNDTLTRIAGSLRRQGLEPPVIEAALLEINTRQCSPPLDRDEVSGIARSVGRYTPVQASSWRVGAKDGDFTSIEPLIKIASDPPHYNAHACGRPVKLTHLDLIEFKRFKVACITQLDFVPVFPCGTGEDGKPLPVQITWEKEFLAPALANAEYRVEDAPEDAGLSGAAWQNVLLFFKAEHKSDNKEVIRDDKLAFADGCYWFKGRHLRKWLALNNLSLVKPDELWKIIREHSGKNTTVKCRGKVENCWKVPDPDGESNANAD